MYFVPIFEVKELFTDYQPFYTIKNVPTYMVIGTYLQVY